MNYSLKLKDPRWQKKRLEILNRDEFTCQLCGDKETTLHVHHKSYMRGKEPWQYGLENFVAYCEHCHALIENRKTTKAQPVDTVMKSVKDDRINFFVITNESNVEFIRYDLTSKQFIPLVGINGKSFNRMIDFYQEMTDYTKQSK